LDRLWTAFLGTFKIDSPTRVRPFLKTLFSCFAFAIAKDFFAWGILIFFNKMRSFFVLAG